MPAYDSMLKATFANEIVETAGWGMINAGNTFFKFTENSYYGMGYRNKRAESENQVRTYFD